MSQSCCATGRPQTDQSYSTLNVTKSLSVCCLDSPTTNMVKINALDSTVTNVVTNVLNISTSLALCPDSIEGTILATDDTGELKCLEPEGRNTVLTYTGTGVAWRPLPSVVGMKNFKFDTNPNRQYINSSTITTTISFETPLPLNQVAYFPPSAQNTYFARDSLHPTDIQILHPGTYLLVATVQFKDANLDAGHSAVYCYFTVDNVDTYVRSYYTSVGNPQTNPDLFGSVNISYIYEAPTDTSPSNPHTVRLLGAVDPRFSTISTTSPLALYHAVIVEQSTLTIVKIH